MITVSMGRSIYEHKLLELEYGAGNLLVIVQARNRNEQPSSIGGKKISKNGLDCTDVDAIPSIQNQN